MARDTHLQIPNDTTIVIVGTDASQCLVLRKRLQGFGLKNVKEYGHGSEALRFCSAHNVDVIYIAGRPADMDALTFVRAARSGKNQVVAALVMLADTGSNFSQSEQEFLEAYHVTILRAQVTDDKKLSGSLQQIFGDKSDVRSVQARLEKAKDLMSVGLLATAHSVYQQILSESDTKIVARVGLMRATAGDPKEQFRQLELLLKQDPVNYSFRFELIERLIQQKRLKKAERLLTETLVELSDNKEVFWLNELGIVCVGLGLYPFCVNIAGRLTAMAAPSQAWLADLLLSRTQLAAGNLKDAEHYLGNAIKRTDGQHAEIENLCAILATRHGEFEKAIESYLKALAIAPDDHRIAYNIGLCYEKVGKADEALKHFRLALQLAPTYTKAREHLEKAQSRI